MHLYGHHTFVWEKCWEFQTTSPLKPLGHYWSNFIWNLLRFGERKIVKMVAVHWPRWLPCPYKIKTFKNLLLQNQISPDALSLHKSSRTGDPPKLLKWWSYVDVCPFYGKVKFASPCICMGPIYSYEKNVENSYFGRLLYNPVESKLDDEHLGAYETQNSQMSRWNIQDSHHSRHLENLFSTSLFKPKTALSRHLLFI